MPGGRITPAVTTQLMVELTPEEFRAKNIICNPFQLTHKWYTQWGKVTTTLHYRILRRTVGLLTPSSYAPFHISPWPQSRFEEVAEHLGSDYVSFQEACGAVNQSCIL